MDMCAIRIEVCSISEVHRKEEALGLLLLFISFFGLIIRKSKYMSAFHVDNRSNGEKATIKLCIVDLSDFTNRKINSKF